MIRYAEGRQRPDRDRQQTGEHAHVDTDLSGRSGGSHRVPLPARGGRREWAPPAAAGVWPAPGRGGRRPRQRQALRQAGEGARGGGALPWPPRPFGPAAQAGARGLSWAHPLHPRHPRPAGDHAPGRGLRDGQGHRVGEQVAQPPRQAAGGAALRPRRRGADPRPVRLPPLWPAGQPARRRDPGVPRRRPYPRLGDRRARCALRRPGEAPGVLRRPGQSQLGADEGPREAL